MPNIILCGANTHGVSKPCLMCKRFLLWGTSAGYCLKKKEDVMCYEHCKYYKRSKVFNIKGKLKIPETEFF